MIPCLWSIACCALQSVRVVDAEQKPVAQASVLVGVGLAHFDLTEDTSRWSAVRIVEATADEQGVCELDELPGGSHLTVMARSESLSGLAEGELGQDVVVVLQPTGTLTGKVSSKKSLSGYSVHAISPRGFETWSVELTGEEWTLPNVPVGEVELQVRLGNWIASKKTIQLTPGKPTKVPAIKVGEEFLLGADPLVDVRRVRLVDASKKPLPKLKMAWSSPMMDGWMPSDEEGEILLEGGGVAIGSAPFALRLASLGIDQEKKYLGKLLGIERGTAVVQTVATLEPWSITAERAGDRLEAFQAFAVTGGKEPRVWFAKREGTQARFELPPGKVRLFIGTVDGKLHEQELDRPAGEAEHTVQLGDG